MTTTTSLLHTALQNLHVAQQVAHPSHTPRPPSSVGSSKFRLSGASSNGEEEEDDNEIVKVGLGTAPGTPIPGRGMVLGQRIKNLNSKDPVSGNHNRESGGKCDAGCVDTRYTTRHHTLPAPLAVGPHCSFRSVG